MREAKKFITAEYLDRLENSPYFIVVDYTGLTVDHFSELRTRLRGVQAEAHVVKNRIFKVAAKESGVELTGAMKGQLAVVTGAQDIAGAAKILKTFESEFEKPKLRFGYMGEERLEEDQVKAIAELPSLDVLRAKILGVLNAPAQKLATLINTPGTQLAQVLKAKAEKGE
ncbi:MAG: 50S ribosomal protein L10 [Verrucomicrobiales bacterium]|nr:50S ribosomal protein L10 [Verrucomicrobiales bacterium]|tara:strand:+ start:235 stop:744 length:510 start_codon:yes stop_codon:yes gene_type:complete